LPGAARGSASSAKKLANGGSVQDCTTNLRAKSPFTVELHTFFGGQFSGRSASF